MKKTLVSIDKSGSAEVDVLDGLTPLQIFERFAIVPDEVLAKRILHKCVPLKFIPFIDFHQNYGLVFHSLCTPDGLISKRPISHLFVSPDPRRGIEAKVQAAIVAWLIRRGKTPRTRVYCSAGIADIVTEEMVIEVEPILDKAKIFEAVGQVLLYRQSIDPKLRAAIAGPPGLTLTRMRPLIKSLGVEVMTCKCR